MAPVLIATLERIFTSPQSLLLALGGSVLGIVFGSLGALALLALLALATRKRREVEKKGRGGKAVAGTSARKPPRKKGK